MGFAGLALEVKDAYERGLIGIGLLFRDSLGYYVGVVVHADDGVVVGQFAEDLEIASFVHPNLAARLLIRDLCLLDEALDEVVDGPVLAYEDVVVVLVRDR